MNPWIAVLRALPITFVVAASSTLLAAAQALPSALELERLPGMLNAGGATRIAAFETLIASLPVLRAQAIALGITTLCYVLLSPWLHMAWLDALSAPKSPGAALGAGLRLTPRAVVSSLSVGIGSLLLLTPWLLAAWATRSWLVPRANVRVQDLATLLALLPCVPSLFVCLAWHDLARARCLSTGGIKSAFSSLRDALSVSALTSFALWSGLGWAVVLGCQLATFRHADQGGWMGLVTLAVLQGAALTRSVVRSRWLTSALLCADARPSGAQKSLKGPR